MAAKENKEFVGVFNKMSGRIKTVTRTASTKKSISLLLEEVKKVESDLKDESKYNLLILEVVAKASLLLVCNLGSHGST